LALALLLGIPLNISLKQIPAILLLGIVGFAASLYFFLHGLNKIGTTNTLLILSLSSVFGLVLASIFLHEQISTIQIIAGGIMLFGIYLVSQANTYTAKTKKQPVSD
jgi:drug/metabolite transporter (DMT)-like permease